jgi:hypothetical protein
VTSPSSFLDRPIKFMYSIAVRNSFRLETSCGILSATSWGEAQSKALKIAYDTYPVDEDYLDHCCSVAAL